MSRSTTIVIDAWKERFVLQAKLNSETKRVRYLLDLSSPAEREQIESDFFNDDDAFQEMLTAEDDLIDAYARGELASDERRRFEKSFVSSLRGRDRVQFAHAFAGAVSETQPVETKFPATFFKTLQSPGLLRIAAVIVFVALFAWLVTDRWRMTSDLRELRAESAELSKRIQQSSDTERTRTAEFTAQFADLRAPGKTTHRERVTIATQQARHLPEKKNDPEKFALLKPDTLVNNQDATLGNTFEPKRITELPLDARNVPSLLTLQPATTRGGYVAGDRSDQTNVTLDGVDVNPFNTYSLMRPNTSRSGGTIVRGIARDPQGKFVSGATVTLTDSARNLTRTQFTNKEGAYVFNAIPPGTYSIEVTAQGFKTASASGLAALVDTPTVCDVQLEVGAVYETVNVTSAAETAINTSDATLGNSFERKRIVELPLNANNVVGLLSLQGVSRTRTDQSKITLDSVDATIRIPSFLTWVRFQIGVETAATHEDYRVTIKTADSRRVTSVDWIEPLTPNQTIIDTPAVSTSDLPSGDYVLLLMGKEPDGTFVKVAEYAFKVIKY